MTTMIFLVRRLDDYLDSKRIDIAEFSSRKPAIKFAKKLRDKNPSPTATYTVVDMESNICIWPYPK